jgi:hypothetical protein
VGRRATTDAAGRGRLARPGTSAPTPNGGYLLALAGAALQQATPGQPDPLSITAHYLRPGLGDQPAELQVDLMRRGRTLSTARARLLQDGQPRLELLAAMGTLGPLGGAGAPQLTLPPPDLPPPDDCPGRSAPAQGVSLSILDRLDIRLHPQHARAGEAGEARVSGWIRFRDGRDADPLACLLMADAFPPAVFGLLGQVGWVPTVELTVHLRARPAPGWLRAQFVAQDPGRRPHDRGRRAVGLHRPPGGAVAPVGAGAPARQRLTRSPPPRGGQAAPDRQAARGCPAPTLGAEPLTAAAPTDAAAARPAGPRTAASSAPRSRPRRSGTAHARGASSAAEQPRWPR